MANVHSLTRLLRDGEMRMGLALLQEEKAVLELANTYGDGLDLSGPRVSRSVKKTARWLLDHDYLSGPLKSLRLTHKGKCEVTKAGA